MCETLYCGGIEVESGNCANPEHFCFPFQSSSADVDPHYEFSIPRPEFFESSSQYHNVDSTITLARDFPVLAIYIDRVQVYVAMATALSVSWVFIF